MSLLTYHKQMKKQEKPNAKPIKPLAWLHGEVKTPPFSAAARIEAGGLIRRIQNGELLPMPLSRPMSIIGSNCHELRVNDETLVWRIMYRIDADAIVILEVFPKKSPETPKPVIDVCKARLKRYEDESK
jgi:phage-related protein